MGLHVVGVTSETKANTEPWVADNGVEYAYAYDTDGALSDALGVRGIPHAVLVDPYGQIVWRGHPMSLDKATAEGFLGDALKVPLWDWPESAGKLREAINGGRLGAALGVAKETDLSAIGDSVPTMLRKMVDGKVSGLAAAIEDHDVRTADGSLDSVKLAVEGLPEAEKVEAMAKRLADDEGLAAAREAFNQIDAIMETLPRTREDALATELSTVDGWVAELEKVAEAHGEKAPGRAATESIERIGGLRAFIERESAND